MSINRELCGVYFRIERDGKSQNICFSDMTQAEQESVLVGKTEEFLKSLCYRLADVIREIGDELQLVRE